MIGVRTRDIWEYVSLFVKYDVFWGKDFLGAMVTIGYSPSASNI